MKASHELPTRAGESRSTAVDAGDALGADDTALAGDSVGAGDAALRGEGEEPQERFEDELMFIHLERDQLVAVTSRPVSQARLGAGAQLGLWALRIFVIVVSLMVIYTFIAQLQ